MVDKKEREKRWERDEVREPRHETRHGSRDTVHATQ
jgi:hypothetical protein